MLNFLLIFRNSTHFTNIQSGKIKFFNYEFSSPQTAPLREFPLKKSGVTKMREWNYLLVMITLISVMFILLYVVGFYFG